MKSCPTKTPDREIDFRIGGARRNMMRSYLRLVALAVAPLCFAQQKPGWKLTFQDEFDGARLDLSKWNPEDPWGKVRNGELQAYVKDAFDVSGGLLRIRAQRRPATYDGATRPYSSGMMTTYGKFA
jgi:beta-glucanase (GH16 family)